MREESNEFNKFLLILLCKWVLRKISTTSHKTSKTSWVFFYFFGLTKRHKREGKKRSESDFWSSSESRVGTRLVHWKTNESKSWILPSHCLSVSYGQTSQAARQPTPTHNWNTYLLDWLSEFNLINRCWCKRIDVENKDLFNRFILKSLLY